MSAVRTVLIWIYYQMMVPIWRRRFSPRIIEVELPECRYRFFVGTPQAASWYDPPKHYTLAEYEWVLQNIQFTDQEVIDAGAHHGHYALVFAMAGSGPKSIHAVEPLPSNCSIIEVNAALNNARIQVVQAAISTSHRLSTFIPRGNGRLFPGIGIRVQTFTLAEINHNATIIKLDIEGMEFEVLKHQAETMSQARAWIVEVHPRYGDPNQLVRQFTERQFQARYLDKRAGAVVRYQENSLGAESTTVFFTR